jgi:hypothetical protein
MVIRQVKCKVWSEYDCYTYLVFVDLDDDIKSWLGVKKAIKLDNYWVWVEDESLEKYCFEHLAHKITDRQIDKWLE